MLFDTRNQRSYVTDALVKRPNLKLLKREKLQLNTFDELGFKGKMCDLVKVYLRALCTNEVFQLKALQFPTICSSVSNPVNLVNFLA